MRDDKIEVRPSGLRQGAFELDGSALRLGCGLGTSGLTVGGAGWATTAALVKTETGTHRRLCRLGARAAELAASLRAAADGYDAVDERAARRLRQVG